jgi:hypothetical protein
MPRSKRSAESYFGTTDRLPPGDPGGGITGVVELSFRGGFTIIPGSTFGGVIVPFCCDNFPLMLPSAGAIFSGGGDAELGGATGTVGFSGEVGCGFCASAGAAARINAVSISVRSMGGILVRPDP